MHVADCTLTNCRHGFQVKLLYIIKNYYSTKWTFDSLLLSSWNSQMEGGRKLGVNVILHWHHIFRDGDVYHYDQWKHIANKRKECDQPFCSFVFYKESYRLSLQLRLLFGGVSSCKPSNFPSALSGSHLKFNWETFLMRGQTCVQFMPFWQCPL